MEITENYQLAFDPYNVIVKERYEKKEGTGSEAKPTGEFDYKAVGYCKDLEHACLFILNRKIHGSEAVGAKEMISVIQQSADEIKRSVERAGIDHRALMEASAKRHKEGA